MDFLRPSLVFSWCKFKNPPGRIEKWGALVSLTSTYPTLNWDPLSALPTKYLPHYNSTCSSATSGICWLAHRASGHLHM